MRPWEIYDFPYPTTDQPHPCVILSPDFIADSSSYPEINCLACQSLRGRDEVKPREVRLNGADGLDGPTVVRCHVILHLNKNLAGRRRGSVTPERRRVIRRKLRDLFGLHGD